MRVNLFRASLLVLSLAIESPFCLGQNAGISVLTTVPGLGEIEGFKVSTIPEGQTSKLYNYFAGIPYADPDSYTGANRFKPSKIWDKELPVEDGKPFLANNALIRCPQVDMIKSNTTNLAEILQKWGQRDRSEAFQAPEEPEVRGNEDCLVVNVNTASIPQNPNDPAQLKPVIVFVHGGSWAGLWGGIFGGERFLNHDVVFVTLNYRLGVLGALNLGIDGAPGNAAMYDIITALKWVNKYIRYFGGDPTKVTVTGQSAGAMLASLLLTTPLIHDKDSEGNDITLMHGLIALSGSSLSPIAISTDPLKHHLRVSHYAGCYNETADKAPDFNAIRNCMAGTSLPKLMDAMSKYTKQERLEGRFAHGARVPSLQIAANLDPTITDIFMTESPLDVFERKGQLNVPVMMGTTRHDGGFLLQETYDTFLEPHDHINDPLFMRNDLLPVLFQGLGLDDPSGELHHSVANIYMGDATWADDFQYKIPGLIDIHSVFIFKAGAYQLVELNSEVNPKSYYFSFEHKGLSSLDGGSVVPGGIGHIDSLFYLFKAYPLNVNRDLETAKRFVNYWINFAYYQNPNGNTDKTVAAPYNPINHPYLVIGGSFDWTRYYCRDSWINNSLELMEYDPTPSPTTTSNELPSTETTSPSDDTDKNGDGGAKSHTLNIANLLIAIISFLIARLVI